MKTYISKLNIFRKMHFLVLYIINLLPNNTNYTIKVDEKNY